MLLSKTEADPMEPFKNEFSFKNACRIADRIHLAHPAFPMATFRKGLEKELEPLELKSRMQVIARRIAENLPSQPPEMFPILVKTLAKDETDQIGLRGFAVWPLTEIVATRGLDSFKASMDALHEMTKCFTAEFAIRPFLRLHRKKTLAHLKKWSKDPDPHVRRLISEGTRPLLPWGERLPEFMTDPGLAMPLLERLHRDESDYVRLSVSNHLNDFSKAHPELVMETLSKWRDAGPDDPLFAKLARHASRTLIKQGHSGALSYHGFGLADDLKLVESTATTAVKLGGHLEYRLRVKNTSLKPMRVLFDYAILHLKANGTQSPKVFKGRTKDLAPGGIWEIQGKHPIKPITTRVYYSGAHGFEPRLNGKAFNPLEFHLEI